MSVLSHSDTELGPSLGSLLSPIKSPKVAEPGSCQPGSVAELGLRVLIFWAPTFGHGNVAVNVT